MHSCGGVMTHRLMKQEKSNARCNLVRADGQDNRRCYTCDLVLHMELQLALLSNRKLHPEKIASCLRLVTLRFT